MPRVSIGLPVYNGENYLREAVDSILSQSFEDFELIISDNASTDATEQICRAYAAKDQRIRYYRNSTNVGAAKNFNRVFELSSGQYFKWAAHDDILTKDYLSKCVATLDQDFSIVLCYPMTKIIDEHGQFIRSYNTNIDTSSTKPQQRFRELVLTSIGYYCFEIFGVMRSAILKKTPVIASYSASDKVLLAELSLYGRFHEIPEYLFFRRNHPQQSTKAYNLRSRTVWFDPSKKGSLQFLMWRIFLEYCLSIKRAPLSWGKRTHGYLTMETWLRKNWKALAYDFIVAAEQLLSQGKG